jgi:hypothetical protein
MTSYAALTDLSSAFEKAARTVGEIDHSYLIAGNSLLLRFAGTALIEVITPALEHLQIPSPRSNSLTVGLFDSFSTGIHLKDLPESKWENWFHEDDSMQVFFQKSLNCLYYRDKQKNQAFFWTMDSGQLPSYIRSWPLVPLFHWWLAELGFYVVHAASVGNENGAILLTGNSGSGKSTTAFVCLNSSLQHISDDRCLVSLEPQPRVYSLFNSAKVDVKMIRLMPTIPYQMGNPLGEREIQFFLHRICPEKICRNSLLRAIVSVKVTPNQTTLLKRASASDSLIALAPSTILRLPGARNDSFHKLAKIVRKVPAYRLHSGTDPEQIPSVLSGLLNSEQHSSST